MPRSIARRHWLSTAVFALFNLYEGATQPGIDNAAHVGGLISGLAIGWCLARPLWRERRVEFPYRQVIAATALFAVAVTGDFGWIHANSVAMSPTVQYMRAHEWYMRGEAKNLREWQALAAGASSGQVSDAQLGRTFQRDILPFWQSTDVRLTRENRTLTGPQRPIALLIGRIVRLRLKWAKAVISATLNEDPAAVATAKQLMAETTRATARLALMTLRANMAHRPGSLSQTAPFLALRRLFHGGYAHCVTAPFGYASDYDPKDDTADGSSIRHALGCQAQRLFLAGDYGALDGLMRKYADPREVLPDGTSGLSGIVAGIDALFAYGGLNIQDVAGRTADWRRAVPRSVNADLVEVLGLENWAWAARGQGYANAVTPQQMAIFSFRIEMAAVELADLRKPAQANPLWYQLSLENGLDDSETALQMRPQFDLGRAKFPRYWSLYQALLRAMMPRWGGSYGQVDGFIQAMSSINEPRFDAARYARLYTMYSDLEGQNFDPFTTALVDWPTMKAGYDELLARDPHSEYLLNRYANFACRAMDRTTFQRLRPMIATHVLPDVWSMSYTLAKCDAGSKTWTDRSPAEAKVQEKRTDWIESTAAHSLGPITLGMSKQQLLGEVGEPIAKDQRSWTYNSIDASHDGVLSAYFTRAIDDQKLVYAIEYIGDWESAPRQVAYLDGLSKAQLAAQFSGIRSTQWQHGGFSCVRFANGVYACLRHGVVKRYGIEFVQPT